MNVGIGTADITPPVGVPGRLGIQHTLGTGGHPVQAKALCLGGREHHPVLEITCEIVGHTGSFIRKIHRAVEEGLGIPRERVVLTCTHTHCSPWVWELQADAFVPYGYDVFDRRWERRVIDGCLRAAREAVASSAPATLSVGSAKVVDVASNRVQHGPRWSIVPDPQMRTKPTGDIDPEVRVLKVTGPGGSLRALAANYACHPSGFGGGKTAFASPDFPWYAEQALQERTQSQAPLLYWMGCSGNINAGKFVAEGSKEEVEALGRRLADGIAKAMEEAVPLSSPPDRAIVHSYTGRYEPGEWVAPPAVAREEFAEVAREVKKLLDAGAEVPAELVGAWRRKVKHLDVSSLVEDDAIPADVSCIDLGEARLLFIPGEWYHSYGRLFQEAAPGARVFTTTMTTIDHLYMPDEASMPHREWYGVSPHMRTISDDAVRGLAADASALVSGEGPG